MAEVESLQDLCDLSRDVTDAKVLLERARSGELYVDEVTLTFLPTDAGEEDPASSELLNSAFLYAIDKHRAEIEATVNDFFRLALTSKYSQAEDAMALIKQETLQ